MASYYRTAPIMAYPHGRILRHTEAGEFDVWTGHIWDRTSITALPSTARPITEDEAKQETTP